MLQVIRNILEFGKWILLVAVILANYNYYDCPVNGKSIYGEEFHKLARMKAADDMMSFLNWG